MKPKTNKHNAYTVPKATHDYSDSWSDDDIFRQHHFFSALLQVVRLMKHLLLVIVVAVSQPPGCTKFWQNSAVVNFAPCDSACSKLTLLSPFVTTVRASQGSSCV